MEQDDAGSAVYRKLERAAGQLSHLFRKHQDNSFMMGLHNMLGEYFAQRIAVLKEAEACAKAADETPGTGVASCEKKAGHA